MSVHHISGTYPTGSLDLITSYCNNMEFWQCQKFLYDYEIHNIPYIARTFQGLKLSRISKFLLA